MSNMVRHFETENVISVYNTLFDGAVDLAVRFGVVSSKLRTAGRQRNRSNPHVADTKDYRRIILYYQFLDHFLNELRGRFVKNADRFLAQLLIPINLNKLKQEDELHIYDAYRADLQIQQQFNLEAKGWKARCELYPTDHLKPSHLYETLK